MGAHDLPLLTPAHGLKRRLHDPFPGPPHDPRPAKRISPPRPPWRGAPGSSLTAAARPPSYAAVTAGRAPRWSVNRAAVLPARGVCGGSMRAEDGDEGHGRAVYALASRAADVKNDEDDNKADGHEVCARAATKDQLRRSVQEEMRLAREGAAAVQIKAKEERAAKKKRLAARAKREEGEAALEDYAKARDEVDAVFRGFGGLSISGRDDNALGFPQLRRREAAKRRLLVKLSDEWGRRVDEALAVRSETVVFAKSVDGVALSRRDLARVLPGEPWLNDEVVNAWYANLCARLNQKDGYVKGPDSVPRWVAYSSAWYKTATERGVANIAGWSRRKGIKGDKLLRAERVFFPTNTGAHWTLLTISGTNKSIEYLDSMDETGWQSRKLINLAKAWLQMELGNRFVDGDWDVLRTSSAQQDNTNDCGVFACLNGWALAKGSADPSAEFVAGEMQLARRLLVATLMNGGFTGDFDI